jgi:hypothetical protein
LAKSLIIALLQDFNKHRDVNNLPTLFVDANNIPAEIINQLRSEGLAIKDKATARHGANDSLIDPNTGKHAYLISFQILSLDRRNARVAYSQFWEVHQAQGWEYMLTYEHGRWTIRNLKPDWTS